MDQRPTSSLVPAEPGGPPPPEASARGVNLVLGLSIVLVLVALLFSFMLGVRTSKTYLPQTDAATHLRLEAALAHLWFEEFMGGDPNITAETAWSHMDAAGRAAGLLLQGGARHGIFSPPLDDSDIRVAVEVIRDRLATLRELMLERIARQTGIGTKDDARFDAEFRTLQMEAEQVEMRLQALVHKRTNDFIGINALVILGVLGVWGASMFFVRRFARLSHDNLLCAQQASREAEARQRMLATTLRSMGDGVLTTDERGVLTYMNPAAEALTGWAADSALGRRADGVLAATEQGDDSQRLSPVATVIASKAHFHGADGLHIRTSAGVSKPASLSAAPILDDGGELLGAVLVLKDMTAQKLAMEKALAASRAKSEFLANMSHELRTPISGILGMTDLVLMDEGAPKKREYLGMVKRSAQNLLYIINDVLDLAKVESGKIELVEEGFSPRETLDGVLRSFALTAREKGLELAAHAAPDVPLTARGDPYRLEQVLRNLLSNAIKFTERGAVSVELERLGASADPFEDVELRFTVRDTGIGIPADRMGDLFKSFTQLDASYSKRFAGTGLGLAISKEMVEMMGGRIQAQSQPGQGSAFSFTVRLRPDAGAGNPAGTARPTPRPAADPMPMGPALAPPTGLRILAAEDDPTNRLYIEHLLTEAGHSVTLVENGHLALEALRGQRYDLVLMDVQMPGMGGLEATRRIRASANDGIDPTVPVIALTAYAMKGDREHFMENGMDGYLPKPLDPDEFGREVARVMMEKRRAAQPGNGPETAA